MMRTRAKAAIIAGAIAGACLIGVDSPWTVIVVMLLITGVVAHLAAGRGRYLYLREQMWSQHHAYLDGNDSWGVYGQAIKAEEYDPARVEIERQVIVDEAIRKHANVGRPPPEPIDWSVGEKVCG